MKIFAFLFFALGLLLAPARAAMTDWTEVQGGAVRLVASGPASDGTYEAGLEFLLDQGWHTYWKHPGEAGIPPQVSFDGSVNLGSAEILYPAPERYDDGFSQSIVYHNGIVLPIRVTPATAGKPVTLSMNVFFGICNEICVPGDADLTLALAPQMRSDSLAATLIGRDLSAVPQAATEGQIDVGPLAGQPQTLLIRVRNSNLDKIDVFAAGPEGSYIGMPKPLRQDGADSLWSMGTKGLAKTGSGSVLNVVMTSQDGAVEHVAEIPGDWLQP
ncbi:hypothetical protein E1180_19675 [Roseibium denhamense]|uniref:Thiol-disulfide interchange protein, contains DsbC and DsbD domains n=1 Tax=Roseibium denhamense TaxID=76305 RepID=A0ABY1P2M2_9HYPH|nr:protein-disulfide reductase DsbD domain-containing protein [Roseibium denhamense]MTI07727.1 hypothetical protein [Roseibium denhamense]SMP24898.1 Thiol-disulfide interchange protein, contains DsbC and DsbD domains [Roseibium denhamense]